MDGIEEQLQLGMQEFAELKAGVEHQNDELAREKRQEELKRALTTKFRQITLKAAMTKEEQAPPAAAGKLSSPLLMHKDESKTSSNNFLNNIVHLKETSSKHLITKNESSKPDLQNPNIVVSSPEAGHHSSPFTGRLLDHLQPYQANQGIVDPVSSDQLG